MNGKSSCDQTLRAIGQALEARRIQVFELKNDGQRFVVRGEPEKDGSLFSSLRQWRERLRRETREPFFTYAAQEIEKLEREGRAKRTRNGRLPDFYSLSNTLRTVGLYLAAKEARLIELHKTPLNLMLLYETKEGHPNVEERSVASFYDLFVQLHGRRGKAPSA